MMGVERSKPKTERVWRMIVDATMTAGIMYSMAYQLFPPGDHEWAGVVLLCLFVCHHVLNRKWFSGLLRGRYGAARVLNTSVDAAILVFVVLLMWSGIAMSQHVFTFLPPSRGLAVMRRLHLIASAWTFVLVALHLGLHWHQMTASMRHDKWTRVLVWLGAFFAAYGVYVFIARDFVSDMFLLSEFRFLDYDEAPLRFFFDYSAVFTLFIFAGYWLRRSVQFRETGKRQN